MRKILVIVALAIIAIGGFYMAQCTDETWSIYLGGAMFCGVVFPAMIACAETMDDR